MAQKAFEQGLVLFNMKISPDQIKKEIFINILICFKKYKMEDHTTANCPRKNTVICSECAGNNIWKDCTFPTKNCINCDGTHRTMAMTCPKRKEMLREKEEREKQLHTDRGLQRYAQAAKLFKENQQQNKVQLHIENNTHLHVLQCRLHAHFINI